MFSGFFCSYSYKISHRVGHKSQEYAYSVLKKLKNILVIHVCSYNALLGLFIVYRRYSFNTFVQRKEL